MFFQSGQKRLTSGFSTLCWNKPNHSETQKDICIFHRKQWIVSSMFLFIYIFPNLGNHDSPNGYESKPMESVCEPWMFIASSEMQPWFTTVVGEVPSRMLILLTDSGMFSAGKRYENITCFVGELPPNHHFCW